MPHVPSDCWHATPFALRGCPSINIVWVERDLIPDEFTDLTDEIRTALKSEKENEEEINLLLIKTRKYIADAIDSAVKDVWHNQKNKMKLMSQIGGEQVFLMPSIWLRFSKKITSLKSLNFLFLDPSLNSHRTRLIRFFPI